MNFGNVTMGNFKELLFQWFALGCFVSMTTANFNHEVIFKGKCDMLNPCSQKCVELSYDGFVCACEPESHFLAQNGFLCIKKTEQIIDIDSPEANTGKEMMMNDEAPDDFDGSGSGDSYYDMEEDCEEVKCHAGGMCEMDLYGSAHCQCKLGTQGRYCEDSLLVKYPNFFGNSYMEFPTLEGIYHSFDIGIDFKPRSANGLLMFSSEREDGTGDYMAIMLVNGHVEFSFNCGTGPAIIRSNKTVTLNEWHSVMIGRDGRHGYMSVDNQGVNRGMSKGPYSKLTLRQNFYLGGHRSIGLISSTLGVEAGFSGCVERLIINDEDYDMRKEPLGLSIDGIDVGECSSDVCKEPLCKNGGTCVAQSADSHLCLCPLGYSGPACEQEILIHIPSFNGSSHLIHESLGNNHLSFIEIEIIFKPRSDNGMLVYSGFNTDGTGDFVSLALDNGHVEFRFDNGDGPAILRSDEPITMDQWHIVVASRTDTCDTLQVDSRPIVEGMASGGFTQTSFKTELYIGGVDNWDFVANKAEVSESFIGDIQRVVISDIPVDLVEDAIRGVNVLNAEHPCIGQPCQNHGDCLPFHDVYSCHCRLGFDGKNCEKEIEKVIEVPMFQGESYLWYTTEWIMNRIRGKQTDISLQFRSWGADGLILWSGKRYMEQSITSDFLSIGLEEGFLVVSYNLGGGTAELLSNTTLNDGEWHKLKIERDTQDAMLTVDGYMVKSHAPGLMTSLDVDNGLYLGGMADISELSAKRYSSGLVGCIRDLTLDGDLVELFESPADGRNVNHCQ
ncbi:LOW QUALITY PROTEIN: pikachurin-like [Amphiura filiformis]|uniref:LOW QUALITY PROTEIN: pikachurin-like n=1 Tax=Amphiura filiformis TaxID=82378 RepID=UPI003B20FFE7